MKHTPGPWNIGLPGGPSGRFWSLVNSEGNVVAMQITSEANARLIAAAPELLEACKVFMHEWNKPKQDGNPNKLVSRLYHKNIAYKIEQAITKAERSE